MAAPAGQTAGERNESNWSVATRYFAVVFGCGFALGILRTLWAVPRFGERTAELLEAPFMVVAIGWAARWVAAQLSGWAARLRAGVIALALMLAAEVWFVLRLRAITLDQYVTQRDPIAGGVYLLLLVYFAAAPALAGLLNRSVE